MLSVAVPAASSGMQLLSQLEDPAGSMNGFGRPCAPNAAAPALGRQFLEKFSFSGRSVSVFDDYVLVGLRNFGADSGAADLFKLSSSSPPTFTLVQRLLPDDPLQGLRFGFRVALGPK